ncbi:MAG TPA: hypothetical protein VM032_11135 [Vicinamibacterales bacterium]|nr:hypothetical protein [Vicinamibacterales bacterium]
MTRRLSGLPGVAVVMTALSVFVTWPQATVLGTQLAAHHDAFFSIWRIGWIAHALGTAPLHLFDANIFHPAKGTLAFSDATLLEGLLGAPLFWLGVPPVLTYNLLLLAGFVGSGVAMFVLARHLTGAPGPSLLAAAIFTMLPYRIEHFMHLELQWAMFIPLALHALHRAVEGSSWRWGVVAGLYVWLQLLACVYYGVFLAILLLAFVPALLLATPRDRRLRALPAVAIAALVAALLTIPFALPYSAAAQELGSRTLADIGRYSATPANYFATTSLSWVWGWTADRWGGSELRLFPGVVAIALALCAVVRRPRAPVVLYALTTAVAVELSFGLNSTVYRAIADHVDALRGFRSLSRFAVLASCGVAVLAAYGSAALLSRVPASSRSRRWAVPLLLAMMLADYGNRPMGLTPGDPVEPPDVYKVIRGAAPGAVLELPLPDLNRLPGWEPFYEAWSLWHWKPLVNGYSGYHPADYLLTVQRMAVFPVDGTLDRLRAHDVRYIVVHRAFYDQEGYARLMLRMAVRPELKPWGAYRDSVGTADIFELLPVD